MIGVDEEQVKSHFADDVQPGFEPRTEATDNPGGTTRYDFPSLGISVDADSLEEATRKAEAITSNKPEGETNE